MSDNILATRTHLIHEARLNSLQTNLRAYHGGRPYIEARLCRWPSESDVDFLGSGAHQLSETRFLNVGTAYTEGRLARAFLVNYARRIVQKINQYVFQQAPHRDGVDTAWSLDVTRTGMSINQFFGEISALVTATRWCWIGVDRPAAMGPRSKAEVERARDRVYLQLYGPDEVVDWSIDSRGEIAWLITEREEYSNPNPREEAVKTPVRYLYEPGRVTRMVLNEKRNDFIATSDAPTGYRGVPFVLVGLPSSDPWWFDDVEAIQRSLLDLFSSLDTAIFKTVFPVLVVPRSFADEVRNLDIGAEGARRKIGMGNPIVESGEESGVTRWLSGTTADLEFIRQEIDRRQADLYDIVGLAMHTPESRQVASAESKQWDHLDTEAVLAERATMLEESEQKIIEMARTVGGEIFTPYKVTYAKKFDLTDFAADIQAITSASSSLDLPPEANKMLLKAAVASAGKRFNTPPEALKKALDAIDTYEGAPVPDFRPATPPEEDAPE